MTVTGRLEMKVWSEPAGEFCGNINYKESNMLGITVNYLNLFIELCGGNKSLFGKTIKDVYFEFIETRTNNNKEEGGGQLSLCEIEIENLKRNTGGSKESVYYIHSSHNYLFLDVYESIIDFINNSSNTTHNSNNHNKGIILWWDIFSNPPPTTVNDKNVISNQIYNASSLINNTIFIVSPRYEYIHSAIGWTLFIYKHLQMILSSTYTPRDGDSYSTSSSSDNSMCRYEVLFTTQIYTDRYLSQQQQTAMQTDVTDITDQTTTPIHSPYLSTVIDAINNTDIILTHINTIIQSHTPSKAHTTSTSYTQKGHNSYPSEIESKLDDLVIYIALLHETSDKHSIIAAFTEIATYDLLSYTQTLLQQLYHIHTDLFSNNTNTNSNNTTHTKHTTHSINNIDTTTHTITHTTDLHTPNSPPDTASPTSTSTTSSNEVEKEGREDKAFFDYTTTQSLHLTPLVSLGFVDYYDDDIHRGQNYDQSGGGKRVRREKDGGEGDGVRGVLEKQNSNNSTNSADLTSTASTYPSPRDPLSVADSTTSTTTPTTPSPTALTAEMSLHIRLRYLLTVPSQLEHIVNNADLISLQALINNVFLPQCVIKTSSLPEPG